MTGNLELSKILIFLLGSIVAMLIAALFYLYNKLKRSNSGRKELVSEFKELENKVNALKLETLESKLNPHLFKNIFNSIQSHAYQTYFALEKLSNVLDYILYESRNKFVTPKEEIDFALNLIEINKIKLSPLFELKVKTKIHEGEPLFEQNILAPLITIDLIENAFKHADIHSQESFIAINFEFKSNTFSLTVANKKALHNPFKKEKSGIGAESFEQRLKIIYKEHFKLERKVEGDVYIAHLKIDLLGYKTKVLDNR